MITNITIEDPVRGMSSVIKPRDGIAFQGFSFPPTVREETEDLAGIDGADDTTALFGAAAFTMRLTYPTGSRSLMAEVAAYLRPDTRPNLIVSDSEWPHDRKVQLRYSTHDNPLEKGRGLIREVLYTWVAPRGCWEETEAQEWKILAGLADTTGLAFTPTLGVRVAAATGYRMPPGTGAAATLVSPNGNARPRWSVKLYGPGRGPKLARDDTGLAIAFKDSLWVASGEYVWVDPAGKKAWYMGDPAQRVDNKLDVAHTSWFPLDNSPTQCQIRYFCSSDTDSSTAAILTAWPAWIPE